MKKNFCCVPILIILLACFSLKAEHKKDSDSGTRPTREIESNENKNSLEDPCLKKLTEESKNARNSTSMREQEQQKATHARTFLELTEKQEGQLSNPLLSSEENLYSYLKALSSGDPLHDKDHLWHQSGGMSMPENFQNLVTTLDRFSKVSDKKSQRQVLNEAVNHLGWLTSTNFHVPPARGSGFTDNRYLYDYAKTWLECLDKQDSKSNLFREIGPVKQNDLDRLFTQAQDLGYKHIVVRYGNDQICQHCKKLRGELEQEFKDNEGILVISVNDNRPLPSQGIPQSEVHSLGLNGNWKKSGPTLIGSENASALRQQIQKVKSSPSGNK